MPDKLTIHIKVDDANRTVSQFAVSEKGQVTFYNDANALATVKFDGASPLCQGNTPKNPIEIPGGANRKFQVCNDTANLQFKYTATVDNAQPEDPILIIESVSIGGGSVSNPIIWVEMAPGIVIGLVLGAIAGYLIARRRAAQNRPR